MNDQTIIEKLKDAGWNGVADYAKKRLGTVASSPAACSRSAERAAEKPEEASGGREERPTVAEDAAVVRGRRERALIKVDQVLSRFVVALIEQLPTKESAYNLGKAIQIAEIRGAAIAELEATGERSESSDPTLNYEAMGMAHGSIDKKEDEAERAANDQGQVSAGDNT